MNTKTNKDILGFTVIEMIVATTVLGVLASVTVPTLVTRRISANEASVISTLRAVSSAQFQFHASGELDLNYNTGNEYGMLGELASIDPVRGTGEKLIKNLLPKSVANVDANGIVTHHGYHFRLFLPDASGKGVPGTQANAGAIDANNSHLFWTMAAWPVRTGSTGNYTYFVNQQGQVLRTRGKDYGGTTAPQAGAGLTGVLPDEIHTQSLAANRVGADGKLWVIVH